LTLPVYQRNVAKAMNTFGMKISFGNRGILGLRFLQGSRQTSISAIKNQRNEHILYIAVRKYNLEPLP